MYSFRNDYSEGAHPRILNVLASTNLDQSDGYGEDSFSLEAASLIRQQLGRADIDVHFLAGGTQTNLTALSAFLRPHEAAIAVSTGHILVHETGAIEATGHKILAVETSDGKISPEHIQPVLDSHTDEHMVKPRLVYISNPTEIGTIYTKTELQLLSAYCRRHNLYLYVDGARLGSALCVKESGLSLADLGRLTDAFYIGGTKGGALLGEALVICSEPLKQDFRFHMKQKGALLAKGWILGLQFRELFRDNLYFQLAGHANEMATLLRQAIQTAGFNFLTQSPTNQIFPVLPHWLIEKLQQKYAFYIWSVIDNEHSSIRLVTSWATPIEAVQEFIADMRQYITERTV
ncbi:MAG: aminotransferase class I/II-fold pyridoxal phosphate-dependent enzyme [Veillonellaceae bacterium]|nr:aminotransferase class I/II-fold pyridoxal phosphate-dependent enzyme [Veillonellaceae bacterium]